MTPLLLDHVFVVLVLGVVFPLGGWWAYRRFLARLAREGQSALVAEYRNTLLWLLGLGAGAILVWLAAGRPLAGLGFRSIAGDADFALAVMLGALGGLAARPLLAWRSAAMAAALRKQFGALEAFLPKTVLQLRWALAVSIFAGVFEEIAYRGYLMAYLGAWFDEWAAIALSSVIFGFAHLYQGKLGMLVTAVLGALFGYLYLKTGSLILPILLHTAVDLSAMVTAWLVLRRDRPATG